MSVIKAHNEESLVSAVIRESQYVDHNSISLMLGKSLALSYYKRVQMLLCGKSHQHYRSIEKTLKTKIKMFSRTHRRVRCNNVPQLQNKRLRLLKSVKPNQRIRGIG